MKRLRVFGFSLVAIAAVLAWCVSLNVPTQLRANVHDATGIVSDAGAPAHARLSALADGLAVFQHARIRSAQARAANHHSRSVANSAARAAALAASVAVLDAAPSLAISKSATFAHSTSAIPPPHA